jgi:hypothetical protein
MLLGPIRRSVGRPAKNIDGELFGLLEVLRTRMADRGPGASRALVRCSCCGKVFEVRRGNLLRGRTRSCGSLAREQSARLGKAYGGCNRIDLTGKVFDELTAIGPASSARGVSRWRCRCSCGKECVRSTKALQVEGKRKSCGHLARGQRAAWIEEQGAKLFPRRERLSADPLERRLRALRKANEKRASCDEAGCAEYAHYTWRGRGHCRTHLPAEGRTRLSTEWQMANIVAMASAADVREESFA